MKWPIYFHSSTSTIGSKLDYEHKILFSYLLKELNRYLTSYSLKEDLLKDFLASWKQINNEQFLPILHQIVKYLRHRLIDANTVTYHRLVHLCNALIRVGGTAAHVLIGREKFLKTLVYCMAYHAKSRQILARESAAFSFQNLRDWKNGLKEREDLFPHYSKVFEDAAKKLSYLGLVDLSGMVVPHCEREPVKVDNEYRILNIIGDLAIEANKFYAQTIKPSPSPAAVAAVPVTQQEERQLRIAISDDDASLQLNRISSSMVTTPPPTPATVTTAPLTPATAPLTTETTVSSFSVPTTPISKKEKLTVIVEEEDKNDADSDESTAAEPYGDNSSVNERQNNKHASVGTVYYDKIYKPSKSTDEVKAAAKKTKSIEYSDSPHGKSLSANDSGGMDITFKYYGTQRVVSYTTKRSNKNVLTQNLSQPILQQ